MTTIKKGLGRGLSALIPDSDMEFLSRVARGDISLAPVSIKEDSENGPARHAKVNTAHGDSKTQDREVRATLIGDAGGEDPLNDSQDAPRLIELQLIEANPYQPRRVFAEAEMQDLVASVQEHGIIQPILVRPAPSSAPGSAKYQLIAGERRWRASQAAGLSKIPAVVRQVSDQQALELALIENVQRHDISAIEAAKAYRRLADEFALSQERIAQRVGKSRPAIANTLRLLDLPLEAQKAIEDGIISEGHGRAILLAPGDGARRAVFRSIIRDKITVRQAEELSRKSLSTQDESRAEQTPDASKPSRLSGVEMRALRATEEELSKSLGTRVRVKPRAKGGQICIEYFSPEDLDELLGRLRLREH